MSTHPAKDEPRGRGLLLLELDGAGSHPAAWRVSARHPAAVLAPENAPRRGARRRVRRVPRGDIFATPACRTATALTPRAQTPPTRRPRRLNALQRAAFAGPVTRSLALIPEVDTVYTEPFHVSTQLASLDYVSGGRAGWLVAASTSAADAAAVGRDTVPGERTRPGGRRLNRGQPQALGLLGGRRRDP